MRIFVYVNFKEYGNPSIYHPPPLTTSLKYRDLLEGCDAYRSHPVMPDQPHGGVCGARGPDIRGHHHEPRVVQPAVSVLI